MNTMPRIQIFNSIRVGLLLVLALCLSSGASSLLAQKKIKVVATLPYLAELTRIVGGDLVEVMQLAEPGGDPHSITTTPTQALNVSKAKLFIENGMALEGWAIRILDAAKNPQLRAGKAGHLYASNGLIPVEVPSQAQIDAGGHIHAAGNPHIWLDPGNLKVMVRNIEKSLAPLLYDHTAQLTKNRVAFEKKLDERMFGKDFVALVGIQKLEKYHKTRTLLPWLKKVGKKKYKGKLIEDYVGGWLARARALKGTKVITYHKTWSYFEDAFGIEIVGTIEEKPGIPASPSHLDTLKKIAKKTGVRIVLAPPYYPSKTTLGVARHIGGIARILPTQPGEIKNSDDLFAMFDRIFDLIESAAKEIGI